MTHWGRASQDDTEAQQDANHIRARARGWRGGDPQEASQGDTGSAPPGRRSQPRGSAQFEAVRKATPAWSLTPAAREARTGDLGAHTAWPSVGPSGRHPRAGGRQAVPIKLAVINGKAESKPTLPVGEGLLGSTGAVESAHDRQPRPRASSSTTTSSRPRRRGPGPWSSRAGGWRAAHRGTGGD